MKKNLAIALILVSATLASATDYKIDPTHTSAGFSVRHLMISNVTGQFTNVQGVVIYDPANPKATVLDASIDTKTVDTREPKRDEHLRSADFLDVANHPVMTFKSKKVVRADKDSLKLLGDLTIRGVTREVTLDVAGITQEIKDPWGNIKRGATATTKVNRKDFGLTWNAALETGGVVVGDEVTITINVELTKAK
ncbi:MAG: polyisoprenoid-binding protein [Acidobacteriales bacterium]|nr:polyisoprenoid-binding protein [Terriglobales bacterium]